MKEIVTRRSAYAIQNDVPVEYVVPIIGKMMPRIEDVDRTTFVLLDDLIDINLSFVENLKKIRMEDHFIPEIFILYSYIMTKTKNKVEFHDVQKLGSRSENIKKEMDNKKKILQEKHQIWIEILDDLQQRIPLETSIMKFKAGTLSGKIDSSLDFYFLLDHLPDTETFPVAHLSSGSRELFSIFPGKIGSPAAGKSYHDPGTFFSIFKDVSSEMKKEINDLETKHLKIKRKYMTIIAWLDESISRMTKESFKPIIIYRDDHLVKDTKKFMKIKTSGGFLEPTSQDDYNLKFDVSSIDHEEFVRKLPGVTIKSLSMGNIKFSFEIYGSEYDFLSFYTFVRKYYNEIIWTKNINEGLWERQRKINFYYNIPSNFTRMRVVKTPEITGIYLLCFSLKNMLQINRREVDIMTTEKQERRTRILEHRSVYQVVRVTKCYDMIAMDHFIIFFSHLFSKYQEVLQEERNSVKKYIGDGYKIILQQYEKDYYNESISKSFRMTKLSQLSRISPHFFPKGYPYSCPAEKQPIIIKKDEVQDWKDMKFYDRSSGKIVKREILSLDDRDTEEKIFFVCPNDSIAFPGVKPNNFLTRKDRSSGMSSIFLPCCFQRSQMKDEDNSFYNYFFKGRPLQIGKGSKILKSNRILNENRLGELPEILQEMFKMIGLQDIVRKGVKRDEDSFLRCCLLAAGKDDDDLSVKVAREELLKIDPSVISQEITGYPEDFVKNTIGDHDLPLDPKIFGRMIEEFLQLHILILSEDDLVLPVFSSEYYIKEKLFMKSICIFYHPPSESNPHHVCEILVKNILEEHPIYTFDELETNFLMEILSRKLLLDNYVDFPFKVLQQGINDLGRIFFLNCIERSKDITFSLHLESQRSPRNYEKAKKYFILEGQEIIEILSIVQESFPSSIAAGFAEEYFCGFWFSTNDEQKYFIPCRGDTLDIVGIEMISVLPKDVPPASLGEIFQDELQEYMEIWKINIFLLNITYFLMKSWKDEGGKLDDFLKFIKVTRRKDEYRKNVVRNIQRNAENIIQLVTDNVQTSFDSSMEKISILLPEVVKFSSNHIVTGDEEHRKQIIFFLERSSKNTWKNYDHVNLREDLINFGIGLQEGRTRKIFLDEPSFLLWISSRKKIVFRENVTIDMLELRSFFVKIVETNDLGLPEDSSYIFAAVPDDETGKKVTKIWKTKNINISDDIQEYENNHGKIEIVDVGIHKMILTNAGIPVIGEVTKDQDYPILPSFFSKILTIKIDEGRIQERKEKIVKFVMLKL